MEQAVNTFQKGLNTDSHPMAQSNDRLTDALNATFVTQNGNEIILQNDMGNRRIDNAFLPSGYQPVGMKEYGGIIYVAAYNPITNKSQIGSFPSPERKLSVTDGNFIPVTINNWIEEFINSEKLIDKDFILKPLTLLTSNKEYLSIHPGDKFTVYSDEDLDPNLISNYHNIYENLVDSPKNKLYTLSIGVLNSQNEFVDITSSLARWRHNTIYEFSNNESELYKFNYGYFIPKQTNHSGLTLDDQKFSKERESIEANTYSYKLVGPLYLKIQLNHINKFNYIITGENGNYLKIRYIVEYNCPDYGSTNQDQIDQYAHIDTLKTIQDSFVDLIINNEVIDKSIELVNSSYNLERNVYSVEYICTYNGSNIWSNVNNDILHIKLSPKVKYEGSEYYIQDLTIEEDINVTLLNSNTINIKEWRFTNDVSNKKSILTYSFECYPDENIEFSNLQIKFFRISSEGDVSNEPKVKEIYGNIYSGRNTIEIDWNETGLDTKALYIVKLYYDKIINYKKGNPIELSIESQELQETDTIFTETKCITKDYWFLTTELLNEFYYLSSEEFVPNFCIQPRDTYPKFEEALIIHPDLNPEYTILSDKSDYNGSLVMKDSEDKKIIYTRTQEIIIDLNKNNTINDQYPDCIFQENPINSITIIKEDNSSINGQKDTISITDTYNIESYNTNPAYTNGFSTNSIDSNNCHEYFQLGVGFQHISGGSRDRHVMTLKVDHNVASNSSDTPEYEENWKNNSGKYLDHTGGNRTTDKLLDSVLKNGLVRFWVLDYMDNITDFIDNTHILYYGFGYSNYDSQDKDDETYHQGFNIAYAVPTYGGNGNHLLISRMWIRGNDGQLALIQNNKKSGFKSDSNIDYDTSTINDIKNKLGKLVYLTNNSGNLDNFIASDVVTNYELKLQTFNYEIKINGNFDQYFSNNSRGIFKNNTTIEPNTLAISINTQPFYDYLFDYRPNNIRNIWLKNGSVVDENGNPLNPNNIYIEKNGKLQEIKLPLRYSSDTIMNDKNVLLFYGTNKPVLYEKYDSSNSRGDDAKTYLDYSGINVLDLSEIQ